MPPAQPEQRNWLPLGIAAGVILLLAAGIIFFLEHGKTTQTVTPVNAQPDAYAASLPLSHLEMSESGNLSGGKMTYLDGRIANTGSRTVTAVTVQVLFRDMAHEVAQNETVPLQLIRTREPYIDIEPVSAEPLKPGGEKEFRLIFDRVSPDWDGAYPDLRVLRVETR